eukprot:783654-Rhodomonas_salina.1
MPYQRGQEQQSAGRETAAGKAGGQGRLARAPASATTSMPAVLPEVRRYPAHTGADPLHLSCPAHHLTQKHRKSPTTGAREKENSQESDNFRHFVRLPQPAQGRCSSERLHSGLCRRHVWRDGKGGPA